MRASIDIRKVSRLLGAVGITSRLDREQAVRLAAQMGSFLEERVLRVIYEPGLAARLRKPGERLDKENLDLAVVVGGDGTILKAVHALRRGVPILAVNFGAVGFLADVSPENALKALQKVLEGRFTTDECFMLLNNVGLPDALNEVRVGTGMPSQMVELEVLIDETPVARDRVDAVLVATTTGSSGYTLSAGGAVVDPRLKAIVVVPVCPLSSNFRSYVIPWDSEVCIKAAGPTEFVVIVDGQFSKGLEAPAEVRVKKAKDYVTFLRVEQGFYERLRRRLTVSSLAFQGK